jgi:ATP-dependent RNA helicase DDX52/ROK1
MDELFKILSSSARIDKSKRIKRKATDSHRSSALSSFYHPQDDEDVVDGFPVDADRTGNEQTIVKSRDRTGKRDTSQSKLEQVHKEQIAAFRRSMNIKLTNKSNKYENIADPISSFIEIECPDWWRACGGATQSKVGGDQSKHAIKQKTSSEIHFQNVYSAIIHNIELGKWKEPTPIQMQVIPLILQQRRDCIGCAATGSGKSGAFIIPALFLSSASHVSFYGVEPTSNIEMTKKTKKRKKKQEPVQTTRECEIRTLIIAPSLELASQLHREVERLGTGKPGGISALLLSKTNAAQVIAGTAGGKHGLDVLVTTPLRLCDSIRKGLSLDSVRFVVLDEADRLLDATDGSTVVESTDKHNKTQAALKDDVNNNGGIHSQSGSGQSQTFLSQMDLILSQLPVTAVRALFSATVTTHVRQLAESILRNPVDVAITTGFGHGYGGANPDIEQELLFVGREEGKLLAIRQFVSRGQLRPPVIIFLQSQDRAQALFGELVYDGIHVDVIHAGRSKSAREIAVANFRKGDTWVLICTDLVARGVDFRAVNMVINYDLPSSGVTYVHRIGRTGRAGRKGKAITLFTEADFENLRTIANVMKQSGCEVPEWMLNLKKTHSKNHAVKKRPPIDTTPSYDKKKLHKKTQMIKHSQQKKREAQGET